MKNFLIFIATALALTLAYLLGGVNSDESKEKILYRASQSTQKETSDEVDRKKPADVIVSNRVFSIPTTVESAISMIDSVGDAFIEEHMESFIGTMGANAINEKKHFVKKLAYIYFEDNTTIDQDIVGSTYAFVSNSQKLESTPLYEMKLTNRNFNKKLYVHITIDENYLNKLGAVFVKWKNISTGETLLFTRKPIDINTVSNWVSFLPNDGWQKGDYEVKIFEFSDRLLPLSHVQYTIY